MLKLSTYFVVTFYISSRISRIESQQQMYAELAAVDRDHSQERKESLSATLHAWGSIFQFRWLAIIWSSPSWPADRIDEAAQLQDFLNQQSMNSPAESIDAFS